MTRKLQNTMTWLAIALMVASASSAQAEGRLAGMLSGGMNAARSIGGRAANRAVQGAGLARGVASRGANVAQGAASRTVHVGTQVATHSINAAGSAATSARIVGGAVANRAVDVGTNVATRGVIAAGSAANAARLAGGAAVNGAADLSQNVATRGVNALGSAANSARLAGDAVQTRIDNLVPGQALAAGVARFNNATQIIAAGTPAAAQNIVAPATNAAPGIFADVPGVVDGALQVGGGLANANVGQVAEGVVNIVDASQPRIPAEAIPIAAGALGVAGGIVAGGGAAASGGGGGGSVAAAPTYSGPAPAAYAPLEASDPRPVAESAAEQIGAADLVLEDLQLAARATIVAGPAYVLRFRNQGSAPANGFHVALLAGVNSQVTDASPRALAYVASVAPGQTVEVVLRLPASATQIPGADGRPTMMTHVFVALDFADAIAELDEVNNLAIVADGALQTAMR